MLGEGSRPGPEVLQIWEDILLDCLQRLVGRELAPVGPAQFCVGEKRFHLPATKACGALGVLFPLVKLLEEKQIGELFYCI